MYKSLDLSSPDLEAIQFGLKMHLPKPLVNLVHLGITKYLPTLKLQQHLVQKVKLSRPSMVGNSSSDNYYENASFLLLLEHYPVYTTGIRNRNNYQKEAEEANFTALGADFVQTDRGGLITFHGPGQLVAYPILDLQNFVPTDDTSNKKANLLGMRWYVHTLEQSVIDLLKDYNLFSHRSPHTGVWLGSEEEGDERKICAMGVHNSQLVTSHGLALNCNTDLTWFDHIVPCGIEGKGVTSLTKELSSLRGKNTTVDEIAPHFVEAFQKNFKCEVQEYDNSEFLNLMKQF